MLALWVLVGLFDGASSTQGPTPPPTPVVPTYSGGGGGGGGATFVYERPRDWKARDGFDRRLQAEVEAQVRRLGAVFGDADSRQAQRIARKLADFTGEQRQIDSLQRELAKLQLEQEARAAAAEREQLEREVALIEAAIELRALLYDEQDALDALEALHEFETRAVLAAAGITIH